MSEFLLSVKSTRTGREVLLRPGARAEHELIEEVISEAKARGIGFLKTEAATEQAMREAMALVLRRLKSDVVPPARR